MYLLSFADSYICPSNWKLYKENCYYFSKSQYVDWHNAVLACEAVNGSLTSIQDVNENNFIAAEMKRYFEITNYLNLEIIDESFNKIKN